MTGCLLFLIADLRMDSTVVGVVVRPSNQQGGLRDQEDREGCFCCAERSPSCERGKR
jgi:hypothetical protein